MQVLKFDNLTKVATEIEHFISLKNELLEDSANENQNMSLCNAEKIETVIENRKKLAKKLKIPLEKFVFAKQTHSENILIVKQKDCGKGAKSYQEAIADVDALITAEKNICITILVADCVPILLFDKKEKVIAVVHAGWKGTLKGIVAKTFEKMKKEYNCESKNMLVGIGPAIGSCHFEVKSEVFELFKKVFGKRNKALIQRKSGTFIDLWELNKQQLLQAGIENEQIELLMECTVCQHAKFFSARKGDTGRFAVGIMLK